MTCQGDFNRQSFDRHPLSCGFSAFSADYSAWCASLPITRSPTSGNLLLRTWSFFFGYCCFCGRPIRATPRIKDMRGFGLPRLKLGAPKPCVLHCFTVFMHFITSIICHGLWYQMQSARYLHGFLAPPENKLMFAAFCEACAQNIFVNSCVFGFQSLPVSKLRNKKHKKCILKETVCFLCLAHV